MRQRRKNVLVLLSVLSACAPALPNSAPPAEIRRQAHDANAAAFEAKQYAEQAQIEREKAEALLEEARQLLERAEAAERRCAETVKKIPKRPRIIRVTPTPTPSAEPNAAPGTVPGTGPAGAQPTPPPYSASDAP